ncbi:GNAT family N-acetyltransferase [Streptomyces sp. NPDC090231]|uniref:GNAT family N-acetyltransferase n=1 Tax=unclassified Streptomyces TaxID=2593676 RepID=UPI0038203DDF
MSDSVVRLLEDADVPGAAAALVEVHATDGYPVEGVAQPEAWIRPAGVVRAWVAEVDQQIVGHVAIMRPEAERAVSLWQQQTGESEDSIAVLARLFVVRSVRKQAVGEGLMRAAMDYAKAHDFHLVLDVLTKDASAIRLYERLGWRFIGDASHRFGAHEQAPAKCYVWPAS